MDSKSNITRAVRTVVGLQLMSDIILKKSGYDAFQDEIYNLEIKTRVYQDIVLLSVDSISNQHSKFFIPVVPSSVFSFSFQAVMEAKPRAVSTESLKIHVLC